MPNPMNLDYRQLSYTEDCPPQERCFRLRTVLVPLIFIFLHFVLQFFAALIVINSKIGEGRNPEELLADSSYIIMTLLLSGLLSILICALYLRHRRKNYGPGYCGLRKPGGDYYLAALSLAGSSLLLCNLILAAWLALSERLPALKWMTESYNKSVAYMSSENLALTILASAVVVPIAEEVLLRGVIQSELQAAFRPSVAALLTTVIFAVIHVEPVQVSYVFVAGLALSFLRLWSRSLWPSILLHMVFNFFGGVLPQVLERYDLRWLGTVEFCLMLASLPLSLFFIRRFRRRRQEELKHWVEEVRTLEEEPLCVASTPAS